MNMTKESEKSKVIVDLSHYQVPSKINYDKLSKQISFAIIRTQYGSKTIDKYYKIHHQEFKKRGIPTASYAWVRGVSVDDMKTEATDFYNRTKQFNPCFWFLDVEEKSMVDMRAGVSAYVKRLRELGAKKIGIYIANHLYKSFNLNLSEVDAVWIPHYGKNNGQVNSTPSYPCDLHQYTSVGRLDGYNGDLDLSRIISNKSLSFFTTNIIPNEKETVNMGLADWQEEMGNKAIDNLVKKGIVNNPDDWKKKLGEDTPQWLFWSIIDRISKEAK